MVEGTPYDGDLPPIPEGVSAEDFQVAHVYYNMALDTWEKLSFACVDNDYARFTESFLDYVNQFVGTNESPLEHLGRCGLMLNGIIVRLRAGDTNLPSEPPSQEIFLTPILDGYPEGKMELVEYSTARVVDYANARFENAEKEMSARVRHEISSGNNHFLKDFLMILLETFISLDGPRTYYKKANNDG